ncbi:hypothetical protein [Pseudonocardia sp. GCM10023141]|uniref:hypothetical protein n=1 Tax=Pseudonocardia sp. GCM10023141 TaxID=3252653 RepID=UPI00362437F4
MQHAIRLLALLWRTGEPAGAPGDPPQAVRAIRSERRLQALDFWLRNPDYLADELLTEVEAGRLDRSFVEVASSLLSDPEPSLRHYPMPRWLFGAYEPLDDAFAHLEVYGLAIMRRTPGGHRNQFFLLTDGVAAGNDLAAAPSVLAWYPRQIELVLRVAGNQSGSQLKVRQYQQAAYAGTELGTSIAPIANRVRQRLVTARRAS